MKQPGPDTPAAAELLTIRDCWRYAISRFNEAGLTYGHGTMTATDEAAYLVLHALKLPIDTLDPFLDARLLLAERHTVLDLIDKRISTRKPASYLTGEAYIQGHRFLVDERVIVPRSFIGELLCKDLEALVPDWDAVDEVADLCTGSGCLAILAAMAWPEATIDATDISKDALEVAAKNVALYGLEDSIELHEGDLFAPLQGRTYDVILANPPYVGRAVIEAFPPEHRAEPALAHSGGEDGLDIVRRILAQARAHLTKNGVLILEVGTGRAALEDEFPNLPFFWLDTELSEGEVCRLNAADLVE